MHGIRVAVRENRLSEQSRIDERSYVRFIDQQAAWVADQEGEIVGFAAIDIEAGTVWALFVAPDAEGIGAGRALHDALVMAAAERGLARLFLSTSAGTRAERLYRMSGWRPVAVDAAGDLQMELTLGESGTCGSGSG